MRLRKRAEEIISMVDKTEAEFTSAENPVSGDIYIGGGETRAMHEIAEIIKVSDRVVEEWLSEGSDPAK